MINKTAKKGEETVSFMNTFDRELKFKERISCLKGQIFAQEIKICKDR